MKNSPLLFRAVFLFFGMFLLCVPRASALDDWQPITAEDLKLTSADAGNAEAIILYHEVTSDDTKKHRTEYKRIKILTEKGKRYADVEIFYGQERNFGTHITDLKARTISPDGKITPFSGEVFDKTVIKGHGLKYQVKSFTMPDVQVGSIIEWHYTEYWSDEYVVPARWILQETLAQKHVKFAYTPFPLGGSREIMIGHDDIADGIYHVEIGLPKDTALKYPRPETTQLEMSNIPAFEEEEFAPPAEMMKMRVYFYYGNRKMLKPDEFWREQGKYWDKEVDKFIGHSSAVAQAAQQAISASDSAEQKVRKLYALVQKMKNPYSQDRSFIERLADDRKLTTSAEQVLKDESGTHNELTRLFVALVRSLSIPAYMMRVATREETFFQPNLPEWSQLNSEIAIVVVDGKELFLDPGTHLCPFGLLDWKRTVVQGVRQRAGGGTQLSQTPEPVYADAMRQRIADLKLDREGNLKGIMALYWMGQEALQRRIEGGQTDEAGRKKAAEDELKSLLPGSAIVKLDSLSAAEDAEQPLKAVFTVELPGFAAATGKRLLLPTELFQKKPVFVHADRKMPVYFEYPYRLIEKVQITLPAEVQVENLPQSQSTQSDYAICKVQRTSNGKVLELRRDFAINGISFPVAEYPKLKSFFDKVHVNDEEQVTLRTTPVAASN
ncbi:MAG TPA: DUF3857 domain-containing protein [Candidatus Angelobacter sp.]